MPAMEGLPARRDEAARRYDVRSRPISVCIDAYGISRGEFIGAFAGDDGPLRRRLDGGRACLSFRRPFSMMRAQGIRREAQNPF